jgi:hypothetical protein
MPSDDEIEHLKLDLPRPNDHRSKKYFIQLIFVERKTIIFDMDETLIHCVDDIELENPDIIIPIVFPDEDEPVNVITL